MILKHAFLALFYPNADPRYHMCEVCPREKQQNKLSKKNKTKNPTMSGPVLMHVKVSLNRPTGKDVPH